jgi:hypothetical protein
VALELKKPVGCVLPALVYWCLVSLLFFCGGLFFRSIVCVSWEILRFVPPTVPPTPIWATEVGSYFASTWPDTVVAHYFEQIFACFEKKKKTFLEVKWRLCH